MKKIIVIGCAGSGKTTFANKLRDKSGIELFYLDAIWHKPDRTHISREEFDSRLGQILVLDKWIIDGNYSRTLERRMAACDTVILFDIPMQECLDGAIDRIGKERPEMPWTDTELDPWLEDNIRNFSREGLPQIYTLIEKYGQNNRISQPRRSGRVYR